MYQHLNNQYTCENVKLLEVVMEHLLFHWEDIVDVLIDDLVEEEVRERNAIEERQLEVDPSESLQRSEE